MLVFEFRLLWWLTICLNLTLKDHSWWHVTLWTAWEGSTVIIQKCKSSYLRQQNIYRNVIVSLYCWFYARSNASIHINTYCKVQICLWSCSYNFINLTGGWGMFFGGLLTFGSPVDGGFRKTECHIKVFGSCVAMTQTDLRGEPFWLTHIQWRNGICMQTSMGFPEKFLSTTFTVREKNVYCKVILTKHAFLGPVLWCTALLNFCWEQNSQRA